MHRPGLLSLCSAVAVLASGTLTLTGQSRPAPPLVITAYNGGPAVPYTVPKTPWGDPDLQGVWSSDDTSGIPRERPKAEGSRLYQTDEDFAKRAKAVERGVKRGEGDIGAFRNDFARRAFRQTSLIVDPPDGSMPAFTPEALKRRAPRDRGTFGDGPFEPGAGQWGTAVLTLKRPSLVVDDWFVPKDRDDVNKLDLDLGNSTPVVFDWRGRRLAAIGGKGGVVYLMDTAALGGPDHRSVAWSSPLLSNDKRSFQNHGVWGSLGSWTDPGGRVWLYVPTYGPAAKGATFPLTYGEDPNGSIQAFTIEAGAGGGPSLKAQWRSHDLKMPDPVAIANGVVFAYATGEDPTQAAGVDRIQDVKFGPGGNLLDERQRMRLVEGAHGTLFALDAATGRELWSSGAAISDWTHFSMPAVANGRVFVTTNHGHVYAFGLGPDRGERTYAPASPPAAAAKPAPATPGDGGTPPPVAASSASASQALFAVHCATCHGNGGEGRASAHTPDMRDAAWQQARTAAGIDAVIRKGKEGGMPPFEQVLSPQQIEQLVAFVRALR